MFTSECHNFQHYKVFTSECIQDYISSGYTTFNTTKCLLVSATKTTLSPVTQLSTLQNVY